MEVLIFIIVIVVLIVVHELGHLIVAKLSGMRVDEFGLGYPPRATSIGRIGETEITLNWLPFGGFVKIYGEDASTEHDPDPRAFGARPRILQALVLIAGIAMNFIFAFVLLSAALATGTPRALDASDLAHAKDVQLAIAAIVPGSPAAAAGIEAGDMIEGATDTVGTWTANEATDATTFTNFVADSEGTPITLAILRGSQTLSIVATPKQSVVSSDPSRYALGLDVAPIGIEPLSLIQSIKDGAILTWLATKETAIGLAHFFYGVITFHADLSQVAGPVGIAGAVGTAAQTGFGDLLSIAALISINLALINLIPVPALDGGRLLFVIIEAVIRRPIKPVVANTLNAIGFALLILLMFVVTAHDIYKIVI